MARSFIQASVQYLYTTSVFASRPYALVCWGYPALDGGKIVALSIARTDANHYSQLRIDAARSGDPVEAIEYDSFTGIARTTSGITFNTWHHMCGIFIDATSRRAYIDGGNVGTESSSVSPASTNRTIIGASIWDSSSSANWDGRLADAAIYDISAYPGATDELKADAFRDITLQALAAGYRPLSVPLGLQAYWPLIRDEDQDWVGGYDLTAVASPTVAAHAPLIYPSTIQIPPEIQAATGPQQILLMGGRKVLAPRSRL